MPELPEVETIRRVLAGKIMGRRIVRAEVRHPKPLKPQLPRVLENGLQGQTILKVERRAKFLLLRLDQGALLVHLGMTGQLFARSTGGGAKPGPLELPDKHTHLVLTLSGQMTVFFRDIRRFGRFRWVSQSEETSILSRLGPEPLSGQFTVEGLKQALERRQASVKSLLLNQSIVAGLGNIYVDESLFRAKIAPQTPGGALNPKQISRLHAAIREVLQEAVQYRGTSISDYYDPESRRGGFQDRLKVYGRKGLPCSICGQPIAKTELAQRGTHWCPRCQAGPRNKT